MRLPDPTLLALFLASVLLAGAFLAPRVARSLNLRQPLWLRVPVQISILLAITLLGQNILGSLLDPHYSTGQPGKQLWEQLIGAAWWVALAQMLVGFARLLTMLEHRPRETRIVSDLLAGAIYVATMLAIINFVFLVPIRGLLATSGVIAIVLGLALQSTLSDVFSGIAVGLERPYQAGDLVWVEGGIEGHVIQVNWRSTHIATIQRDIAVVPNSIMAKSRLINRSAPTQTRGDALVLTLDAQAAPEACIAALTAAVRACRLIEPAPAPTVACIGLHGDGNRYEVGFCVAESSTLEPARTELLRQTHRHLRHDGIALAVAGIAAPPQVPRPTPADLLAQSELFGVIEPAARDMLAQRFTLQVLHAGDVLIRQGDLPDALFMVASGTLEIRRETQGVSRVVYRVSPGESLGAIGLITGAPYMVTATALTPVRLYRLAKEEIASAIRQRPDLAEALEMLAQLGQQRIREDAAAREDASLGRPELFLSRLRQFITHLRG